MEESKVLRIVYTFFLGFILALFVGLGITTFYTASEPPEYPETLQVMQEDESVYDKEQRKYDAENEVYMDASRSYERNVSIMALIAAVALLAVSLAVERRTRVIADGVMLGGLFTLVYSIMRGFASEDSKYTFLAVAVSLVVVLYLGYRRFASQKPKSTPRKKN